MSIVRIGVAESKSYGEGYDAIFGKGGAKKPAAKKPAPAAAAKKPPAAAKKAPAKKKK